MRQVVHHGNKAHRGNKKDRQSIQVVDSSRRLREELRARCTQPAEVNANNGRFDLWLAG